MAEKVMDALVSRLDDASLDVRVKANAAGELRDSMEGWFQSGHHLAFLSKIVPVLLKVLDGDLDFDSTSQVHKLRNCTLEILHRIPMSAPEFIEPHALQIFDKLIALVERENEENTILCIKILMDLQRHQAKVLKPRIQDLLDLIRKMFETMDDVVNRTFGSAAPSISAPVATMQYSNSPRPNSPGAIPSADHGPEQQQNRSLLKGTESFKALAECPIAVVSIFQAHRDLVQPNLKTFVPSIKEVLMLQAPPQEKAHADAEEKKTIFIGVAKEIKNRPAFGEFITAQVKMMSFLAYLLRVYGQHLQEFLPTLPKIIVRLLRDCPKERCSTRKELLVAIRHVVNFNFRKIFLPHLDELLDERTLLGDGLAVFETQRALAYSSLADLIHHVRESLKAEQVRITVQVYTRNLMDQFPGTSFQTMSAKLLLNMAECIAKLENKQEARYFLIKILNAIGDKFAVMNNQHANAVKLSAQFDPASAEISPRDFLADKDRPPEWDDIDIFTTSPIKINNSRDRAVDPIYDNKYLFKNLVHGLKGLFYQLRLTNPPSNIDPANVPPNWQEVASGFTAEEVQVLIKLFHEGIRVFQYYPTEKPPSESQATAVEMLASHHVVTNKEEKELLETFATIFHHVDPATFHEVFHAEIPHLYEMMFDHPALLQIPQFLLASEATSPNFAGMLLQFLMAHMEDVGSSDINKATILLRLFKLSFMAVTLFSQHNEAVLLPHVKELVTQAIKKSTTAESPMHYFYLLRSLFRSIGGGRFEFLYKEILPLLEMLLDVFNNLISAARITQERDLFVELSLTVPARLSHLLPHLSYLMKPLVLALRAGSDLVGQGLRTLELCVDNLTADYLDPIMAPVTDELMAGLWDHLKPSPYSHFHAHTTMRILGKLGGRNRRFLDGPPPLEYKKFSDSDPQMEIKLIGSTNPTHLSAELGIDQAIARLRDTPKQSSPKALDVFYKQQALKLVTTQVKLLIGADTLPDDFPQLVRLQANDLANDEFENGVQAVPPTDRESSVAKRDVMQHTLKELLKSCIFAASLPGLEDEVKPFLADVYKHFAIIEIGRSLADRQQERKKFSVDAGEGRLVLDQRVLIKAIVESLACDRPEVRVAAQDAIMAVRDAAATLFGSADKVTKLPFFTHLLMKCCHCCYEEEWFTKAAGATGISTIASKLSLDSAWLADKQLEISRALIYAAKDLPEDLPQATRVNALDTLSMVIRTCNSSATQEDVLDGATKIHSLCNFLIFELSSTSRYVREASQNCLALIAELTGMRTHEIIGPMKARLVTHIFTKPLRALTIPIQICYIEAIAFCLKLGNGILEPNEQLMRFLKETIQLTYQEEDVLASKMPDQRNFENVIKLRVSCIRLLSLALDVPEFSASPPIRARPKVIDVFFKCLYNKSEEVVDAANEALKAVIAQDPKLPKDILQSGLRPILASLQNPVNLRVEGLQCLARLLQLLKNYFKVEIGTRLLENIKSIANATVLQKASFALVEQNDKVNVVAAIFNVFHLLPEAAKEFMGTLVPKALDFEQQLRRTRYSPLREPIVKYLNRFAQEAWDNYFSKELRDHATGRFLAQILDHKSSGPLRDVLIEGIESLTSTLSSDGSAAEKCIGAINVMDIVHSICKYPETRGRLFASDALRRSLVESGKDLQRRLRENEIDTPLRLAAEQASEQLMRTVAWSFEHDPHDLDFLFDIMEAVTSRSLPDSPLILPSLYRNIISSESLEIWRTVMLRCIDIYTSRSASELLKAYIMRNLVNPILAMDIMRNWDQLFSGSKGTEFLNRSLIETFQTKLWKPQANIEPMDESAGAGIDNSRMELLQTTAMLLKYQKNIMQDTRKDVIRFAWQYIRLEDVINKHASYVVLAYFIYAFDTPAKIATQVYHYLIRAHQQEARSLVAQALEVLATVIPKRMHSPEAKPQAWVKFARRPIIEDPHNLQQLLSIFQFVSRHSELFYEGKEGFAQQIISSLHKAAQLPNSSLENKKLALSLIGLIYSWEQQYTKEQGIVETPNASPLPKKRSHDEMETDTVEPTELVAKTFIPSMMVRSALLKYLVQYVACLTDRYPLPRTKSFDATSVHAMQIQHSMEMCQKALALFQNFLSPPHWTDMDIDAMFPRVTEHVLTSEVKQDEKYEMSITRMVNTLQLLRVMVSVKPDEWVVARLPQLRKLLEKPVRNSHNDVQDALYKVDENDGVVEKRRMPLVLRILEVLPQETEEDETEETEAPSNDFVKFLSSVASEALSAGNHAAGINILLMFAKAMPEQIDQHVPAVMKALSHIVKEHLTPPTIHSGQAQGGHGSHSAKPPDSSHGGQQDPNGETQDGDLLLKIIDLLAVRIVQLGDNRRPYLSALTTLVEKSPSTTVCSKVLDLVSSWIFTSNQVFPTLKEKTAVVLKMITFEQKPDPSLFNKFLKVIINVYEDPKVTRSELAIRLEPAFLIGTRATDIEIRNRFMVLFDRHLTRTASKRLLYVLASQSWDVLQDSFWLSQIIQLLFGSIETSPVAALSAGDFRIAAGSKVFKTYAQDQRAGDLMLEEDYESFMDGHKRFCSQLGEVQVKSVLEPLCYLQHTDSNLARKIWVALFPRFCSVLTKEERSELSIGMIGLLSKEFHHRQIDRRPNCVQTLLEGIARVQNPRMNFPHHLVKYLARTWNAWYVAARFMEQTAIDPIVNTSAVRESNLDALAEVYAGLQEEDLFYGLWRRRCQFLDTNTALSYEQHGMWDKAQRAFESATLKARTGATPFSQSEYMLWEDHWVLCAQKLQQWDILSDFAKNDNLNDLFLESIWRNLEFWNNGDNRKQLDNVVKSVSDAQTPRRAFFQSFMSLLKLHAQQESGQSFNRICDESIQLSIRKWHQLPRRITNAHIPILQNFQELVEMHDASVIITSLAATDRTNLDQKSPELKLLLGTWRDRLPNPWDDINAWQELVTWRQHIFQLINQKYLSLIPQPQQQQQNNNSSNSFPYRGYHETAWIINRFAHVARKHQLPEVCINQLGKIYTLPNIEIQEAFLKLREQAKCHYQNSSELQIGLDVINNTNLNYFGQQQKAEFYTLKGMFLAKQKHTDEANEAFGSALYFDIKLPKAWAEWARYNDQLYKEDPNDIGKAANAISCYLEAAGTYRNAKSRKLLGRVLWLLSLDDAEAVLSRTFDDFKGDTPVWYWITFIPQLLASLSRPEAHVCASILMKLAKQYPQALYFQLRTTREDLQTQKKQLEAKQQAALAKQQGSPSAKQSSPDSRPQTSDSSTTEPIQRPPTSNGETATASDAANPPSTPKTEPKAESNQQQGSPDGGSQPPKADEKEKKPKKAWEYTEEIFTVLKTAFPLLALSLETMVDQISRNFKCPPDEDAYRLIVALLNDALTHVSRTPSAYAKEVKLPVSTESNIMRFAEYVLPAHIRKAFEADFIQQKPDLYEYIQKLRKWRDRFEEKLDRRPPHVSLESFGGHLSEFKFQKFDEVHVPGQYLLHKDKNQDFVNIERFLPDIALTREHGVCHRRLKIRGHDGSMHSFAIVHPAAKSSKREERMLQLFRFFNDVLAKRKESRRRKISFTLPAIISLTPAMRMVQDDASYVTLQGVYEDHCRRKKFSKDEPILFSINRWRELHPKNVEVATQIRLQAFEAIQSKLVPNDVALDYFQSIYPRFSDFWLFRRQFAYQLAAVNFLSYIMHMRDRIPSKMSIARATGNIWASEMMPAAAGGKGPFFSTNEPVPFRFTPNLQLLVGPLAVEGIVASTLLVVAKCLTEPEFKLEHLLSLFIRDEVLHYVASQPKSAGANIPAQQLAETVGSNTELVVNRAIALARAPQGNLPANQTAIDLISKSVDPTKLAQTEPQWMPYL